MTTHPNGATVYPPVAQFKLQRSYIKTLRWHTQPILTWSQSGSEWEIRYPPIPGYRAYVKLKDGFYNWNSGSWSMGQVIEWCYEQYLPDPTELPAFLIVNAGRDHDIGEFVLELVTYAGTTPRYDPLPDQSATWWSGQVFATP